MKNARGCLRIGLLALLLLLLAGGGYGWYIGFHDRGLNRDFDPVRVAQAESRMWQFYYQKDGFAMAREMVSLMREQMGLSFWSAKEVVEPMARGAMQFSRSGGNYASVLPMLEGSYATLAEVCEQDWDAHALAEAELAWWVARRTPGEDSPEQVGALITNLYALLYGSSNAKLEQAGLLRAQAATLRDLGAPNADWDRIEAMLVESYQALHDGIQQ